MFSVHLWKYLIVLLSLAAVLMLLDSLPCFVTSDSLFQPGA